MFTACGPGGTVMGITATSDRRHGVFPAEIVKGLQDEASTERERAKRDTGSNDADPQRSASLRLDR